MELRKIKGKLQTANKGHQLLKEKTNQLIRVFYAFIAENKKLRNTVDTKMRIVFSQFQEAKSKITQNQIDLLFAMPSHVLKTEFSSKSILNVEVPVLEINENDVDRYLPYNPLSTNTKFDKSISVFYEISSMLLRLSEVEKTATLLAKEIEKCRRRVNALENIIIPKYQRQISDIQFKLAENERGVSAKLIKIKGEILEDDTIPT